MRAVPKNSYHQHCRLTHESKSQQQTHRVRQIQTNQIINRSNRLEDFDDF